MNYGNYYFAFNPSIDTEKDQYVRNSDYGRMMNFINTFTMSGKNKHDDVPDGLAQLSQYAQSFAKNYRIFKRPW